MREVHFTLKIFDPTAPQTPAPDPFALGPQVLVTHPDMAPEIPLDGSPFVAAAQAPSGAPRRTPIRDRIRAGLVAAVQAASPVPVGEAEVSEAIDAATGDRPLLDWLANGGLEKLIQVILALLKLAA